MEDTLRKIQKFAKAGSIISKIILWCTLMGAICSIILLIAQIIYGNSKVIADSKIILDVLKDSSTINVGTIYASCANTIILCVSELIVAKKAASYFDKELKLGSPFNLDLAENLKNLGILTIVIPLVGVVLSNVSVIVFKHYFEITSDFNINSNLSFGLGLCFIFTSLLCKYVAQKEQGE